MVPGTVLKGDGQDVHDGVVQRFAAGLEVHLLRVVGARADDVVGVVAGMQHHVLHLVEAARLADFRTEAAGQIDQRLALIFGRVLLGVGVQDDALGLALLARSAARR